MNNDAEDVAVGQRLRDLRTHAQARRWKTDASQVIGVSTSTYGKIERGERSLTRKEAATFAEFYGVDWRWILWGWSPRECAVLDALRKPEVFPTPRVSSVLAIRKAS